VCVSVRIVAHADLFKKGRVTNYEGLKTPNSITKKGIMDTQNPNEPGKPTSPGQGGQQDRDREERERQQREREKQGGQQGGGQQGGSQQGGGQQGGR